MNHLAPEQLVDAADGTLQDAAAIAHLAACGACRARADQFAAVESAIRSVSVPEPSPLFWDHLAARVRASVQAEPVRTTTRWWSWPILVPLGGLALVVVALTAGLLWSSRTPGPATDAAILFLAETGDPDDAVLEDSWALMSDLVSSLDDEAAGEAGLVPLPGSAERAALALSAAEYEELVRLLRQELGQTGG
jgi:hypothetical protein